MPKVIGTRTGNSHIALSLAVAAAFSVGTCSSFAQTYEFEPLVRDGDTVGGVDIRFPLASSLNNNGGLAFIASFQDLMPGLSIGVFVNDQLWVQGGDTLGNLVVQEPFSIPLSLNDNGDVAFTSSFEDSVTGSFNKGIFINDQLRVQSGDTIDGLVIKSPTSPSLNANGDLAFTALFQDPMTGSSQGIFINDQLQVQSGDTVDGWVIKSPARPSLNANGDLAFEALLQDPTTRFFSERGIFVNGQLRVKDGEMIDSVVITSPESPSLNTNGDLAFTASLQDPETGGFSPGGILVDNQLLVRDGDFLGGFVVDLPLNPSLNDNGDVVFDAFIADPATGFLETRIFIASPIPEPGTAGILVCMVLGTLCQSHRQSKFRRSGPARTNRSPHTSVMSGQGRTYL